MLVKLGSTVTPAYLCPNSHFLTGDLARCEGETMADSLEELEEASLREENLGVVPVEHTWERVRARWERDSHGEAGEAYRGSQPSRAPSPGRWQVTA